ncbi:hypothetical protein DL765_007552 [Monosporascus sp. GIB2]|nr:hypothetical protein DL765_007552 [Monosporascus sp. GIB2]
MKTDNYLNLCLEQAELSPLSHRHGCIVVKGGKVIGKGFNDYRPGFDGGALKTGVLPSKSFALDKQELKSKTKKDFKHFEAVFTGARPGRPVLSMHSEMMAINSALSSSSTLAATSLSRFKPSPTPSRDSKRKRQLRRDILAAFTQSVDFTAAVPQVLQQHTGRAPASGRENRHGGITSTVKVLSKGARSHRVDQGAEPSLVQHCLDDRMKNPRLTGADIYIARLGAPVRKSETHQGKSGEIAFQQETSPEVDACVSPTLSATSTTSSGSLHEELRCKDHKLTGPKTSNTVHPVFDRRQVRDSRPCYRCVSYMHSAGVRRCFWTNHEGRWESAKVRDLFDQLAGAGSCDGKGGDSDGLGSVFVTKHEILMLRRLAGVHGP